MKKAEEAAAAVLRAPTTEETARKRRLHEVLEADRTKLLLMHPFTASLAMHLELVPLCDSRVRTAATDGRRVYFDIDFADSLSPEERQFVLAHEVWHCVLDHPYRRGQRAADLWNLAVDSEVNSILVRDGLRMPQGAVRFEGHDEASAEELYAWLRDTGVTALSVRSFDQHDVPARAAYPGHGGHSDGGGGSGQRELVADPDFVSAPLLEDNQVERRAWKQRLEHEHRKAREHGLLPAGLNVLVDRVLALPRVPWRCVLSNFLQRSHSGGWSYARVSKRHIWRRAWLPGRSGDALELMVAIDTSGSTRQAQGQFLAELQAICRESSTLKLTVVECDAAIHRVTRLTEADAFDWLRAAREAGLRGGGGTDFRPVFKMVDEEVPRAVIFFTDGVGAAPKWPPAVPVIWVLAGRDDRAPVGWGEVTWIS
jgi:predicted metal-dependent peptidase